MDLLRRFSPWLDLRGTTLTQVRGDLQAAIAVTFMSVPQGVAYALIAGLPPAMGLYAGALPAIFGAFFRSSRHVITGPTNALSLLVGTAVAGQLDDPVQVAITLAFLVGLFQLGAGLFRLGALVDYISTAVVLGYITGAGMLIGAGQLPNITATPKHAGTLPATIFGWLGDLPHADPATMAVGLGTAAGLLVLRRVAPKLPGAIIAMTAGIGLSAALGDRAAMLVRVGDLAAIPAGLPPLTLPDLSAIPELWTIALATTVLSLVESSAVARNIAGRTGQDLDMSVEFAGQGMANLAAAFFGAYPTSGSLSRSAANEQLGGSTRLSGAFSGVFLIGVLLVLGPVVDLTPVASLAGLLLVVAWDLVDRERIARLMRSGAADALAFLTTVVGTWMLRLDQAIYLGVAISVVMFVRRASLLVVRDLAVDEAGMLREVRPDDPATPRRCTAIRILHVEGPLFFGAANELRDALTRATADPHIRVLVVRLKRTQGLDFTTADVLESVHHQLAARGRHLLLVGMRRRTMEIMERVGTAEVIGEEHLHPSEPGWFVAMNQAIEQALELAGPHTCDPCPLQSYSDGCDDPS
ncbi:MAG: SulP family sulfate permease [Myxococcota bacterium]|jgi:SulP family sulfate permease